MSQVEWGPVVNRTISNGRHGILMGTAEPKNKKVMGSKESKAKKESRVNKESKKSGRRYKKKEREGEQEGQRERERELDREGHQEQELRKQGEHQEHEEERENDWNNENGTAEQEPKKVIVMVRPDYDEDGPEEDEEEEDDEETIRLVNQKRDGLLFVPDEGHVRVSGPAEVRVTGSTRTEQRHTTIRRILARTRIKADRRGIIDEHTDIDVQETERATGSTEVFVAPEDGAGEIENRHIVLAIEEKVCPAGETGETGVHLTNQAQWPRGLDQDHSQWDWEEKQHGKVQVEEQYNMTGEEPDGVQGSEGPHERTAIRKHKQVSVSRTRLVPNEEHGVDDGQWDHTQQDVDQEHWDSNQQLMPVQTQMDGLQQHQLVYPVQEQFSRKQHERQYQKSMVDSNWSKTGDESCPQSGQQSPTKLGSTQFNWNADISKNFQNASARDANWIKEDKSKSAYSRRPSWTGKIGSGTRKWPPAQEGTDQNTRKFSLSENPLSKPFQIGARRHSSAPMTTNQTLALPDGEFEFSQRIQTQKQETFALSFQFGTTQQSYPALPPVNPVNAKYTRQKNQQQAKPDYQSQISRYQMGNMQRRYEFVNHHQAPTVEGVTVAEYGAGYKRTDIGNMRPDENPSGTMDRQHFHDQGEKSTPV